MILLWKSAVMDYVVKKEKEGKFELRRERRPFDGTESLDQNDENSEKVEERTQKNKRKRI